MSHRKATRFGSAAVLCLAVIAAAVPAIAGQDPAWPLDLDTRYLTSNFMEHRPGRFHAGLDFKTAERPGHPVSAVVDGWISRIRYTPNGYGKALYLRGDDGRTYVYAHLERLADPLRRLVEQTQRRRGRWDVALYFPAGKHAVRAGDVLALSGQSGTSGPHLHFEVRDEANRPLDPQAYGFAVPDTIPPRLMRVRAVPGAPDARVEGGLVARSVGDGAAALPARLDDVRISGAVAFTCRVVETSDIRGHRLEPWRLALSVDDSLVFEARNERFPFDRNDRARLMWLDTPQGRERWLHVRSGDDLDGRSGAVWWADPQVMAPGSHALRLIAEDRAGNKAETAWTVIVGPGGAADDGGWVETPLRVIPEPSAEGVVWLTPFLAGRDDGAVIRADSLMHTLERPVCAVVDSVAIEPGETATMERTQGLEPLGGALQVYAADWPEAESVAVVTSWADSLPTHVGLYVSTSRGWRLTGAPRRPDGEGDGAPWLVDVSGPGRFALLGDRSAPYLGPGPSEGIVRLGAAAVAPAVSSRRWETVPVRLEDLGSGVDAATISAEWDGAALIVEPDLPRRRVLVGIPDDAEPGRHVLRLSAADRSGREIERVYDLKLVSE